MEELAAAEAEVVAKLEADAKRAAAAKAKREKELRRRQAAIAADKAAKRRRTAPAPAPQSGAGNRRRQVAATGRRKIGPEAAPVGAAQAAPGRAEAPRPATRRAAHGAGDGQGAPARAHAKIAPLDVLLAAFASVLSRHARQDVVVVGVEGHPVALACEKNDAFCERVEKARAALRLASLTLEDVLEATSTILDRTYHPVYQASIAATHEFGSACSTWSSCPRTASSV